MSGSTEVGAIIRKAREEHGLSVREAAARLGVDFTHYTRIERGERPIGKYTQPIARLYGLNAGELEARATRKLPDLRPYLRAKYDLDDEAIAELEDHFGELAEQRKGKKRGTS